MTTPGQSTASRPMPRPDDPSTWSDETRRERGYPTRAQEQAAQHAQVIATVPTGASDLGEIRVASLEFRALDPNPVPGFDPTFVVARITRENDQPNGDGTYAPGTEQQVWRLQMLPDVRHRPDIMLQTDGTYRTEARSEQEARAVLHDAAAAMLAWIAENDRVKGALVDGITGAVRLQRGPSS